MGLNSLKELLLKKAEGNDNLKTLIRYVSDDILAEEVFESLEKMAAHKGDKANSAITSFAGSATGADVNMLHDAISHHLSHFAAANKAHPPEKKKATITQNSKTHTSPGVAETKPFTHEVEHHVLHPVAKKHLERAMHLADLAAKASKHSLGKMNFEHVPTHAWEMNRTGDHVRIDPNGLSKYVDDQQGLKRRPQEGSNKFPDYGYLLNNPHPSYKHKGKLKGHEGQYPFEEMKINDKYVHIDPNVDASQYVPHEFDSHPLFAKEGSDPAWEKSESSRNDKHREAYADAMSKWHDSPEFGKWLDRQEAEENANPEAYAARGSKPSKLLEGVSQKQADAKEQAKEEPVSVDINKIPPPPGQTKTITRKAAPAKLDAGEQKLVDDYKAGKPDAVKFFSQFPDMKKKFGVE